MGVKIYKPTTPSLRHRVIIDKSKLWKGKPFKDLSEGLIQKGGRNHKGRTTVRHRGGGNKNLYRFIDFKRKFFNIPATVRRIEYDPNRSAFIALITYDLIEYQKLYSQKQLDAKQFTIRNNLIYSYIIAPKDLNVGDVIISGTNVDINIGNSLKIQDIPVGTTIHNVELKPGKGAQLMRSAGTFGQILEKEVTNQNSSAKSTYAMIKLNTGEQRLISLECRATVGMVSNLDHKNIKHGGAGFKRKLGKRPAVRGVAMNPVDHPHGGGEGKSKGGRPSVSAWGKPTKGKRTRSNKRTQKFILRRRK